MTTNQRFIYKPVILVLSLLFLSSCISLIVQKPENRINHYPELGLNSNVVEKDKELMKKVNYYLNHNGLKGIDAFVSQNRLLLVGLYNRDHKDKFLEAKEFVNTLGFRSITEDIDDFKKVEFNTSPSKRLKWVEIKVKFALRSLPNNLLNRTTIVSSEKKLFLMGAFLPEEELVMKFAIGQILQIENLVMLVDIYDIDNPLRVRY